MPENNIKKNNKKNLKLFLRITAAAAVITVFLFSFFFSISIHSLIDPENIFAQTPAQQSDSGYDFVLVIDESGSMKTNDPQNLRIDAAKLFVYLAEILNKGNRVLVSGFGEFTNVYAPLTDISGNEKELSEAIDKIKSDQDLTDMKGALTKIKEVLDKRIEKRKTIVIFLTDGSLTLKDIPPEIEPGKTPGKKPGRTPADGNEDGGPLDDKIPVTEKAGSQTDSSLINSPERYLEQYKKELLDLCFKFENDGIVIDPIAFTKESEIGLLEQMAYITGGVCLKPEKASDLRNSFIDILQNITSRFIRVEDQEDNNPLTGEIPIEDYIKEAVIISIKNSFNATPVLSITDPEDKTGAYDEYVEEKIFKIAKIKEPQAGDWKYEINGDSIFVFDIIGSQLIEPANLLYTSDARIPLKIKISGTQGEDFKSIEQDLKISASVEDPEGKMIENIELTDNGSGEDSKELDGIFSGTYSGSGISGYYNVSLLVQHVPTQSTSSKDMSYEAIKLPVKITIIEPSQSYYGLNKEIEIQVKIEQATAPDSSERPLVLEDYHISYNISGPQGVVLQDLALLDSGKGPDQSAGDGIYSALFSGTSLEGDYKIDYFITDVTKMFIPASTGLSSSFTIRQVPQLVLKIENNLFTSEKTIVSANLEDMSAAELKYVLQKPDGSTFEGILYDDGNAASGDVTVGDGIYSVMLSDLDLLGKYEFKANGTFKSGDMEIPVASQAGFSKDFEISGFEKNQMFDNKTGTVNLSFQIISESDADAELTLNNDLIDKKQIKSAAFINGNKINANSENKVEIKVELADGLAQREHEITVPVIVTDASGTSEKNLIFTVSIPEKFPPYLLIIVIAAGIAVVAAIVLFIYFLFIRPKKRGI